ncbi:MAG: hypothetical protein ABEJ64_01835 [Candidatus Nanohaloarchaea archaeon]
MSECGVDSGYSFWSEKEEKLLRENYKDVSKSEMLSLLPERSWESIKLKAIDLGLTTPLVEHRQSEEVLEQLRENAEENMVEVDFHKKRLVSYVMGVIDGDGFHDGSSAIGLETKSERFADKFSDALGDIGLNPGRGTRRGKETVWASSRQFVSWLMQFDYDSKFRWLRNSGKIWEYIEGAYDSDGDFSHPGPRICSYDEKEKEFIYRLAVTLGLEASIQSNNVYIRTSSREKFFENVDPVYEKRRP